MIAVQNIKQICKLGTFKKETKIVKLKWLQAFHNILTRTARANCNPSVYINHNYTACANCNPSVNINHYHTAEFIYFVRTRVGKLCC